MKTKVFSIIALCAMCITSFAEETARATIRVTGKTGGQGTDAVKLIQDTQYSDAFDNGVDASKQISTQIAKNVNIYGILGSSNLATVATDDLDELPIGFVSDMQNLTFIITFEEVSGQQLQLWDKQEDVYTIIDPANTYEFNIVTATGNETINDRFQIHKPAEPSICHQYGKLIITGHVGDKVKVLDMEGEEAIAEQTIDSDNKVIELSSLTSGEQYKVIVGDKTMIIRVQ